MSIRVAGHYWVLYQKHWTIAAYYEHPLFGWYWYLAGLEDLSDEDFEKIGEQIICPHK